MRASQHRRRLYAQVRGRRWDPSRGEGRQAAHLELLQVVPGSLLDLREPLSRLFTLLLGSAKGIVGLPGRVRERFRDLDERSDVSESELRRTAGAGE